MLDKVGFAAPFLVSDKAETVVATWQAKNEIADFPFPLLKIWGTRLRSLVPYQKKKVEKKTHPVFFIE